MPAHVPEHARGPIPPRAIHSGFSGPATGEEHQKLRRNFEARMRKAPGMLKPHVAKVGKDAAAIEGPLAKVAALPGKFPADLVEQARVNARDASSFRAVIDERGQLPALWLASEHFGW